MTSKIRTAAMRTLTLMLLGPIFFACSSSVSVDGNTCSGYAGTGVYVARMCGSHVPGNNFLAACQEQLSNCNSDDLTILKNLGNCVGALSDCNQSAVMACIAPRQNLSQACTAAVNVVRAAYESE
jgi:hypothetical protein